MRHVLSFVLIYAAGSSVLFAPVPAYAAGCDSNATQTDMNQCSVDLSSKEDAALNAKYKKIMACLKPASKEAKPLIEAQRAWLKFREAECDFQGAQTEGGSIHVTIVANCLTSLTAKRNKELDYYLTCEEGDVSCPTVDCGFKSGKK